MSALTYILVCALVPLVWSLGVCRVLAVVDQRRRRKQADASPPPDYTI
ncbi:MAG: hypothetical protein ABW217_09570 [Polyangiaceae bacterium]